MFSDDSYTRFVVKVESKIPKKKCDVIPDNSRVIILKECYFVLH